MWYNIKLIVYDYFCFGEEKIVNKQIIINRRKTYCFISIQSQQYAKIYGYSAVQRSSLQQVTSLYFTNVPSECLFCFSLCQLTFTSWNQTSNWIRVLNCLLTHVKEAMVASEAGYYNGYFDYARHWVQGKPGKITMVPDRQS